MTRLASVENEVRAILDRWGRRVELEDITGIQLRIRFYPDGGLVRSSTVSLEYGIEKTRN